MTRMTASGASPSSVRSSALSRHEERQQLRGLSASEPRRCGPDARRLASDPRNPPRWSTLCQPMRWRARAPPPCSALRRRRCPPCGWRAATCSRRTPLKSQTSACGTGTTPSAWVASTASQARAPPRQLGAAGEVEALPGKKAHLAHQHQARASVHRGGQRVHGEVMAQGSARPVARLSRSASPAAGKMSEGYRGPRTRHCRPGASPPRAPPGSGPRRHGRGRRRARAARRAGAPRPSWRGRRRDRLFAPRHARALEPAEGAQAASCDRSRQGASPPVHRCVTPSSPRTPTWGSGSPGLPSPETRRQRQAREIGQRVGRTEAQPLRHRRGAGGKCWAACQVVRSRRSCPDCGP